jgi:predicted dehydrogenase
LTRRRGLDSLRWDAAVEEHKQQGSIMSRTRYAIVGTGGRCRMYLDAIAGAYAEHAELVALCDVSATRMDYWNAHLERGYELPPVATFDAAEFNALVEETRPDVVIVTSVDATHHVYIVRALELGCDVVTEKPLTTDEEKAASILDAVERSGGSLRVTFNYRYQPHFSTLREIVASGAIGTPTLVDFQWRLDTRHGADYFRRWHREKRHSGGLLVHKASHHFDLVNFWLDDWPDTVFALGDLRFYGERNAADRGERYDYERYSGHATPEHDPFAFRLDDGDRLEALYRAAEADSGCVRDRNVFGGEQEWPITAEDTMTVSARYRRGALLSYSLIAYSPWEGERVTITGTEGQVEYFGRGVGHVIEGQSDTELADEQYVGERYIRLQRMFGAPEDVPIVEAGGAHGGGDARILERIFLPPDQQQPDPLGRDASHLDGAAAALLGFAANRSIERGEAVRVDDLLALRREG